MNHEKRHIYRDKRSDLYNVNIVMYIIFTWFQYNKNIDISSFNII